MVDDSDGGEADETVSFALDGAQYEIDLSRNSAEKLRAAVEEWAEHARKTGGRRKRIRRTNLGPTPKVVREWARANGYQLSDRGRGPSRDSRGIRPGVPDREDVMIRTMNRELSLSTLGVAR